MNTSFCRSRSTTAWPAAAAVIDDVALPPLPEKLSDGNYPAIEAGRAVLARKLVESPLGCGVNTGRSRPPRRHPARKLFAASKRPRLPPTRPPLRKSCGFSNTPSGNRLIITAGHSWLNGGVHSEDLSVSDTTPNLSLLRNACSALLDDASYNDFWVLAGLTDRSYEEGDRNSAFRVEIEHYESVGLPMANCAELRRGINGNLADLLSRRNSGKKVKRNKWAGQDLSITGSGDARSNCRGQANI